ncbi:MAG: hypothetical protein AAF497_04475, partial [Planctomycetota bacterium]
MSRYFSKLLILLVVVGCGRPRPTKPSFDPGKSASDALVQYDSNGDGLLSREEVADSPGLIAAFERIDSNSDENLSEQELANRVRYYKSAGVAVINGSVKVRRKGKPLVGATVTFRPEPFLGEEFQPCSGETDETGLASLSREAAQFPGIYLGFYSVEISQIVKGKEKIPAKYNTETTLGFE